MFNKELKFFENTVSKYTMCNGRLLSQDMVAL